MSTATEVAPADRDDHELAAFTDAGPSRWGDEQWVMPGKGQSGAGCGEYFVAGVCETCGEPHLSARECGARSCPEGWTQWANDAALRATKRIQSFRETQPDDWHRQVVHATVELEQTPRNARAYFDGFGKAAEIAEGKGVRGCLVIGHPWRVNAAAKELYKKRDRDVGLWVWVRREFEEWRDVVDWGPHYHVVGLGSAGMSPDDADSGYLWNFIRSGKRYQGVTDRESHGDLFGLVRYLLSHTGFPADFEGQSLRWYGCLANNKFVKKATADWQYQKPAATAREAIERHIRLAVGMGVETDEDARVVCESDGCEGEVVMAADVSDYLASHDVPRAIEARLRAAREMMFGGDLPPPGLKNPTTPEGAVDVFEWHIERERTKMSRPSGVRVDGDGRNYVARGASGDWRDYGAV